MKHSINLTLLIAFFMTLTSSAKSSEIARSAICSSSAALGEQLYITLDKDEEFDDLQYTINGKTFGNFSYWELFNIFISVQDGDEFIYVVAVDDDLKAATAFKHARNQEKILEQKEFTCIY